MILVPGEKKRETKTDRDRACKREGGGERIQYTIRRKEIIMGGTRMPPPALRHVDQEPEHVLQLHGAHLAAVRDDAGDIDEERRLVEVHLWVGDVGVPFLLPVHRPVVLSILFPRGNHAEPAPGAPPLWPAHAAADVGAPHRALFARVRGGAIGHAPDLGAAEAPDAVAHASLDQRVPSRVGAARSVGKHGAVRPAPLLLALCALPRTGAGARPGGCIADAVARPVADGVARRRGTGARKVAARPLPPVSARTHANGVVARAVPKAHARLATVAARNRLRGRPSLGVEAARLVGNGTVNAGPREHARAHAVRVVALAVGGAHRIVDGRARNHRLVAALAVPGWVTHAPRGNSARTAPVDAAADLVAGAHGG